MARKEEGTMTTRIAVLTFCAALTGAALVAEVSGQERKHEAANAQKESPEGKISATPQMPGMQCCEGMEKMGGMQGGMPMKGEMSGELKAKMEKMKEMKTKGADRTNPKAAEPAVEKNQPTKDAHQH
jgi:hypothetical protein